MKNPQVNVGFQTCVCVWGGDGAGWLGAYVHVQSVSTECCVCMAVNWSICTYGWTLADNTNVNYASWLPLGCDCRVCGSPVSVHHNQHSRIEIKFYHKCVWPHKTIFVLLCIIWGQRKQVRSIDVLALNVCIVNLLMCFFTQPSATVQH